MEDRIRYPHRILSTICINYNFCLLIYIFCNFKVRRDYIGDKEHTLKPV